MSRGSGAAAPSGAAAENAVAAAKQVVGRLAADDSPCGPLERRAHAARRLPRLAHCGADPILAEHQDWQDAWDVEMARLGLAPEWQRQRARELWAEGVR